MTTFEAPACGCITCGDQGIAMTVAAFDRDSGLALCVDGTGAAAEVDTGLVDPVSVGTRLLVHAGTAIALIAEGTEVPA